MICKNCGGEYDSALPCCPYCKSENKAVVERQKKEVLSGLDREYERQSGTLKKELPGRTAKKWLGYTLIVLTGLLVFLIEITVIVQVGKVIFSGVSLGNEKRRTEKARVKLEQYFEDGDYESMSRYLEEKDMREPALEKYNEVSRIYQEYYEWVLPFYGEWEQYAEGDREGLDGENGRFYTEYILEYCNRIFLQCDSWMKDSAVRGNEAVLEEFSLGTEQLLSGKMKLNEDQIDCLKQEKLPENEITELADAVIEQYR